MILSSCNCNLSEEVSKPICHIIYMTMDYPRISSKPQSGYIAQQEASRGANQPKSTGFYGQPPLECLSKKRMDRLAQKSKAKPKLFSSKSLSQLVPRSLFFAKSTNANKSNEKDKVNNLATTKSFPTSSHRSIVSLESSGSSMGRHEPFISRINSASMIGLPRQSSSSTFAIRSNNSTMEQPNLSPIVIDSQHQNEAAHNENGNEIMDMSWTEVGPNIGEHIDPNEVQRDCGYGDKRVEGKAKKEEAIRTPKRKTNNTIGSKYRPFKNTTLVLRDVKNSIGLRMKAKHESQAFAKLTEEQATPPTKLYSPFNIYTDSCSKDSNNNKQNGKQTMNLNTRNSFDNCETPLNNRACKQQDTATVKSRIAFRHKKHLIQANKFTFDSPTGRLRETVKDVKHFQQCIEDISKAIKARDSV